MKKQLAIFDFDFTLKKFDAGFSGGGFVKLFPNQEFPPEVLKVKKELKWDQFSKFLIDKVNELDINKQKVIDVIANDGELVDGMDDLIKFLSKDHDIIVISGSNEEVIKIFLAKHNLLDFITGHSQIT